MRNLTNLTNLSKLPAGTRVRIKTDNGGELVCDLAEEFNPTDCFLISHQHNLISVDRISEIETTGGDGPAPFVEGMVCSFNKAGDYRIMNKVRRRDGGWTYSRPQLWDVMHKTPDGDRDCLRIRSASAGGALSAFRNTFPDIMVYDVYRKDAA